MTIVDTSIAESKPSVVELLIQAKVSIEAGKDHLRQAAEYLAAAKEQGATQHQIAETLGKSQSWVSGLLKWRKAGYPDTAFGPQAKQSRNKHSHYQATNNHRPASKKKSASTAEVEQMFADDEREQRDAEAGAVIARLRESLPDNEDVMALCDYVEWSLETPPYGLPSGGDVLVELH